MAPQAELDLRVGGLMRVNSHPDVHLGDSQTIVNTVLSFEGSLGFAVVGHLIHGC
jgi:hypothetical protein